VRKKVTNSILLILQPSSQSLVSDYTKLIAILPPNSVPLQEAKRLLQALRPRVDAAQKRETDEMVGKLKDLGNSILGKSKDYASGWPLTWCVGNFGLSTNNFQFVPNGEGGYSMNFVR
jgi:hypothetical protein